MGGGILGEETEAASCLAQAAFWAFQVAQHLDWPTISMHCCCKRLSHLVRCEVEEVESLPHLASHYQLRAFTQLLGKLKLHLRKHQTEHECHLETRKLDRGQGVCKSDPGAGCSILRLQQI